MQEDILVVALSLPDGRHPTLAYSAVVSLVYRDKGAGSSGQKLGRE